MSQVCPSSSHQLVAAAMAFRRARRKFPKNYGLGGNPDETGKLDKTESMSGNEELNDQENLPLSSKKSSNAKSSRVERKTLWNDECGESASIKENLVQKPIICSCCRKRNDQCSAGDTLDVVPSKEFNGVAKKIEFSKSDQMESSDSKAIKCYVTQPRNPSRGRASYSHSGRRSPKETSGKLDSVNLLYDRDQNAVDNSKIGVSIEKRNCNIDDRDCPGGRKIWKTPDRNLRCTFATKKDSNSLSSSRACHCHSVEHSTLDLLRPQRECCHQNQHPCHRSEDHCHHCCDDEHNSNCSSKEKRLASDTCLCSSNSKHHKSCWQKCQQRYEPTCSHESHGKELEIGTVQEQNDDEPDDAVGTISHKDSLCILVEKYKTNKKCKHKRNFGKAEPADERFKDDRNKSFTSVTTCQNDEATTARQTDRCTDRCTDNVNCRLRENRVTTGKPCRHGCGQIFRDEDCDHFKNLKSRLIKTGTCCSAKGTPWRHTF